MGLIGANPHGGWARESHIPALSALPGLELAAVAGRNQGVADEAARAFGVPKAYGDVGALCRDPDIDVITIAATLPSHRELLLPALRSGKHVYCEYPLGLDAAESGSLAAETRTAGVTAAIGLQARANPAARKAAELLASGAIGRVLAARILSTTAGFGPLVAPPFAYTEDPEKGVTVVSIQAAHTIDLALALLGGLESFDALASRQFPEIRIGDGAPQARKTHDHLLLQGRVAGGGALTIEVAGGWPADATPFRFEISGDSGRLSLEGGAARGFQSGRLRLFLNGAEQAVEEGELADLPDAALNVAGTYAALRDSINGGVPAVPGFDHAVRLARLIEDAVAASRTGRRATGGDWPVA
ncbi:Gfo/Idh/MocA family protein [Rhizosaccharibacter radicis]|uniref:Gfo/Idh/MocA family oxidoreductase n=1 Tax=Rhizosaccharibacter radicis TaxID=2782605 RepID=A0ABT1VSH2_9PROT|nr:Gfo/Idh/MocA family oxidoreductase [Acetobacteraceae bacterium KSS12]